jgi:hypothetical protein
MWRAALYLWWHPVHESEEQSGEDCRRQDEDRLAEVDPLLQHLDEGGESQLTHPGTRGRHTRGQTQVPVQREGEPMREF